ncbi:MAG: hypothetical protein GOV15_01425 [Candidatus Diapherotrites archaeon]|nr:hypothetical protein [Candidatus Diapherotrites archaeon]
MKVSKPGKQNFLVGLLGNFGLIRANAESITDEAVTPCNCDYNCRCECNCNCKEHGIGF